MEKIDRNTIPASLTEKSFIGDILVAYGYCTRENIDEALRVQKEETAALTEADKAAGKKARFTGELLVALGFVTQDQIDFGLEVQKVLRGQS